MIKWFILVPLIMFFDSTTFIIEGENVNMLWIPIDRSLDTPLIRQVYLQIRERILNGQLKSDEKLPSTRALSSELKVSRNVILEAYDQLLAEGFLVSRRGSGTFVAAGAFLEQRKKAGSFHSLYSVEERKKDDNIINFRSGIPALDLFPRKTWAKLSSTIWNDTPPSALAMIFPKVVRN